MIKQNTISLKEALKTIVLEQHDKPVISLYELRGYVYELYDKKEFNGKKIGKIISSEPQKRVMDNCISALQDIGVIKQDLNLPIYLLSNKKKPSAPQVICTINPYSYISYLSAMSWHGLTDRLPHTVHVITCSSTEYKKLATQTLQKRFPNLEDLSFLLPPRVVKYPSFDKKSFSIHQKNNFTLPKEQFNSGGVKVSSLGETFLDMLKKPELCGGIEHVIDVYNEFSHEHLPVIVKYLEKNGTNIDKSRAGYILEEVCGHKHKLIDKWKQSVSRGGSRKLLASEPYKDVYSETWCISINN